jgi:Tfp pilus assembly protein PilF
MRRFACGSWLASSFILVFLVHGGDLAARFSPATPDEPVHLGKVNFPTSCDPAVQTQIETGVALLHSFQYSESEQAFTEAADHDPQCAMAHWGKAMARYHQLWDFPQDETLQEGLKDIQQAQKISAPSQRERGYIAAAAAFYQENPHLTHADRTRAYSTGLAQLHAQSPQDVDASGFYALSLVALANIENIDQAANLKKAIAILEPLLRQQPGHPGIAHYLIHATDTAELASQGLDAARRYANIAPDSSHALHMPSHIFTRLGLWQDSISSNLAAAASAARASETHRAESHYQTHAMDYLDYAYLQSGQEARARQMIEDLKDVPHSSGKERAEHSADFSARAVLELHRWKEAAALPIPSVALTSQSSTYLARAIGKSRTGDVSGAKEDTQKLAEVVKAREADSKSKGYDVSGEKATDLREAEAWLTFADGNTKAAIQELRAAADREDAKRSDSLTVPAREMLADMLLELKQPAVALAEYKLVLKRSPNRFDALDGAAISAQAAHDGATARQYFAKLIEVSSPDADRPEIAQAKLTLQAKLSPQQ